LEKWLNDPKGGNYFQQGVEAFTWIDENDHDLKSASFVSLRPNNGERDPFTRLLTDFVGGTFHRLWGERRKVGKVIDEESQMMSYDDSKINVASAIFTTIVSSILPVVTILVLYEIRSPYGRIGVTIGFTAIFAAFLATFSKARRVEIFAATAT
jgi:hypothetical protein